MSVTTNECASMRLLARDGWTTGELKMTMQLSGTNYVEHHLSGDCCHAHDIAPLREWAE